MRTAKTIVQGGVTTANNDENNRGANNANVPPQAAPIFIDNDSPSDANDGSNVVAIVATIIGICCGATCLSFLAFFVWRKRKQSRPVFDTAPRQSYEQKMYAKDDNQTPIQDKNYRAEASVGSAAGYDRVISDCKFIVICVGKYFANYFLVVADPKVSGLVPGYDQAPAYEASNQNDGYKGKRSKEDGYIGNVSKIQNWL